MLSSMTILMHIPGSLFQVARLYLDGAFGNRFTPQYDSKRALSYDLPGGEPVDQRSDTVACVVIADAEFHGMSRLANIASPFPGGSVT
jgi:hypothetical protein